MIPLYTLGLAGLSGLKWALTRRANRTERKYVAAAHQAEAVARKMQVKPGNAAADPFAAAKAQYELGRLVQIRDALELKYLTWQRRSDGAGRLLGKLRGAKGRLVPYLLGVVDVGLVLTALHHLGFPHGLSVESVRQWAETFAG